MDKIAFNNRKLLRCHLRTGLIVVAYAKFCFITSHNSVNIIVIQSTGQWLRSNGNTSLKVQFIRSKSKHGQKRSPSTDVPFASSVTFQILFFNFLTEFGERLSHLY